MILLYENTQGQIRDQIDRVFVTQPDLGYKDRRRVIIDQYLQGEISREIMNSMLEALEPKGLKPKMELTGYA